MQSSLPSVRTAVRATYICEVGRTILPKNSFCRGDRPEALMGLAFASDLLKDLTWEMPSFGVAIADPAHVALPKSATHWPSRTLPY